MPATQRAVIVTGAAHGIGKAIAAAYAGQGCAVCLCDMDEAAARTEAEAIEKQGGRALPYALDLRDAEAIPAMFRAAFDAFGRLDVLVNNAGVGCFRPMAELTVAEWDSILNTNLRAAFFCAQAFAALPAEPGVSRSIVNIASTRWLQSEPGSEAYAASKGGLVSLTHALSLSLAPQHITVNAISPGWIETRDYASLRPSDHAQHPSGRVGTPDDIAGLCLFLTSPQNNFINGQNFVADGGMTKKMIYEE